VLTGLATPAAAQKDKDPLEERTIITLGEQTAIVKKLDTLLCVENDYTLLVAMWERNRSVGVRDRSGSERLGTKLGLGGRASSGSDTDVLTTPDRFSGVSSYAARDPAPTIRTAAANALKEPPAVGRLGRRALVSDATLKVKGRRA
jgi:hypothetical protein